MSTDRWEPYRGLTTLRHIADRLAQTSPLAASLDRLVHTSPMAAGLLAEAQGQAMRMDLGETHDAFVARISLPGVKPEDIQVLVQGDHLRLIAEVREDDFPDAQDWLLREHRFGRFERSMVLPSRVDAERVEAHYEHGLLTLTMPKAADAQPRRIRVGGGNHQQEGTRGAAREQEGTGTPPGSDTMRTSPTRMQGGQAAATREDLGQGGRDATADVDEVTAQSQESFPASDPPSWTATTRIGDEGKEQKA